MKFSGVTVCIESFTKCYIDKAYIYVCVCIRVYAYIPYMLCKVTAKRIKEIHLAISMHFPESSYVLSLVRCLFKSLKHQLMYLKLEKAESSLALSDEIELSLIRTTRTLKENDKETKETNGGRYIEF